VFTGADDGSTERLVPLERQKPPVVNQAHENGESELKINV